MIALREKRRAAQTVERSAALFAVAKRIRSTFAEAKAERGALDFADQVARALALVTRSSAAWVMHKLDYGLDHLLVDEAQDTSAEQWRILSALTAEFFAGAGARAVKRTVFAVGDEKQSIFSFQGAAPEKFAEMRRAFERRHREAEQPFATVPLNFSFRSAPAILAAVDKTFESEAAPRRHGRRRAVARPHGDPFRHEGGGRAVADDRRAERARARRLAHAARRAGAKRSPRAARRADRGHDPKMASAGVA